MLINKRGIFYTRTPVMFAFSCRFLKPHLLQLALWTAALLTKYQQAYWLSASFSIGGMFIAHACVPPQLQLVEHSIQTAANLDQGRHLYNRSQLQQVAAAAGTHWLHRGSARRAAKGPGAVVVASTKVVYQSGREVRTGVS
ncbi:hypothetical protein AWC08_17770 [Mycobacterium gordonae]|uniref:Uncharacterized protein n=1 Tax=Mycobacterium gordonae TaxID=1778 RepID=A0A1X1X4T6_MYCGO|nr:hypothetical protein AWC08_17770 [Mycobacterium gordonae]